MPQFNRYIGIDYSGAETADSSCKGLRVTTFTILTTYPNELLETIHNRMPVIVPPKDYSRWMAPADPAHLPVDLLRPYPADEMRAWKVNRAVGNVRNNSPGLIVPI